MQKALKLGLILVVALIVYVGLDAWVFSRKAFASDPETKRAMEWLREPKDSVYMAESAEVTWELVDEVKEARAEGRLEGRSFTQLQTSPADELLTQIRTELGRPYLLRAVDSAKQHSHFRVTRQGSDIWVSGGALSRVPVQLRRRCVIVWLKQDPREVYVTFGVAE